MYNTKLYIQKLYILRPLAQRSNFMITELAANKPANQVWYCGTFKRQPHVQNLPKQGSKSTKLGRFIPVAARSKRGGRDVASVDDGRQTPTRGRADSCSWLADWRDRGRASAAAARTLYHARTLVIKASERACLPAAPAPAPACLAGKPGCEGKANKLAPGSWRVADGRNV